MSLIDGSSSGAGQDPYAAALLPLDQASSLPAACYTSQAFFDAEMTHIHRRGWFLAGRADEWPKPGDYRAIETVGGPVLVVRDKTGRLGAFANVCRHRGSLLLTGEGNCRAIVCPYHGWGYALDGRLSGAPDMPAPGSGLLNYAENGLVPVRLEQWAGFVFLTFDDAAQPLLAQLGDLPEVFRDHHPEDMVCTWREDIETRCNWKLLLENALESYHTSLVHAKTVGAQHSESLVTAGNWQAIQVISDRSTAVLGDAPPPFPPIEGLSPAARRGTYFTLIHPTTQFAVAQDCLWWLAVRPVAPDRSVLSLGGCFPSATTKRPDFEREALAYYDRWHRVALEDVGMLALQQRGLTSVLHRPGPLSWRDDQVHRLGQWVLGQVPAEAWPRG